jgi:hypothetical protein
MQTIHTHTADTRLSCRPEEGTSGVGIVITHALCRAPRPEEEPGRFEACYDAPATGCSGHPASARG